MRLVAGVDLGGTAINYTLVNEQGPVPDRGPVRISVARQGRTGYLPPADCGRLENSRRESGSKTLRHRLRLAWTRRVPASATGIFSTKGSTNFVHANWRGYDIRHNLAKKIGIPVCYLNDGNAAALWGHASIFGINSHTTSISAIIGTGLGGGVIVERKCGEREEWLWRRIGPCADSVSEHSRGRGNGAELQLRTNRGSRIALLAHSN